MFPAAGVASHQRPASRDSWDNEKPSSRYPCASFDDLPPSFFLLPSSFFFRPLSASFLFVVFIHLLLRRLVDLRIGRWVDIRRSVAPCLNGHGRKKEKHVSGFLIHYKEHEHVFFSENYMGVILTIRLHILIMGPRVET